MTPLPALRALEQYFLEARCKLLDLAAILDRIDRGGSGTPIADSRLDQIRRALEVLLSSGPGRAERVQQIFSIAYDPNWERPRPRF